MFSQFDAKQFNCGMNYSLKIMTLQYLLVTFILQDLIANIFVSFNQQSIWMMMAISKVIPFMKYFWPPKIDLHFLRLSIIIMLHAGFLTRLFPF